MRLILTRPAEDSRALALKLQALGHEAVVCPLLEIAANSDVIIPNRPWAALIITSANGVRCLPPHLVSHDLPVVAVGPQSAQAAREFGFQNVEAHGGDVEGLAAWITTHLDPASGLLLYATGHEISGDLAALLTRQGFQIQRVETYQAVARPLTITAEEISACDGVLLYSPRSAQLWRDEITRGEKIAACKTLTHYCLSSAVAKALPQEWHKIVAFEPTELALLQRLEPGRKGE